MKLIKNWWYCSVFPFIECYKKTLVESKGYYNNKVGQFVLICSFDIDAIHTNLMDFIHLHRGNTTCRFGLTQSKS